MPHPTPRLYLGYESLIRRFGLRVPPLQRIFVATEQTLERHTFTPDGSERIELPLRRLSDPEAYTGQLTFALKREHLNLTVLGALFEHQEARDGVQEWLHAMPSSRYSRMAGHLVEWLSEHKLDYYMPAGNPRIFLLDPVHHVCGPKVLDAKFGIINNVLGGRAYSPLVRRTPRLTALLEEGLAEKVKTAMSSIEPEMLARAVDYLYLSETRSTYNIENEIPDSHRAGRFRKLLESAGEPGPLTEEQLCAWQNQIVSDHAAEYQYRPKQNWLSRPGRMRNIADFIPPPVALVDPMMDDVAALATAASAGELDPVVAATCASFGLVFVHPFFDGNGRLHRFLLHHVLRQAGFTPGGVVLPLSARMLSQLERYSKLLKSYSRPRTDLLEYMLDGDSATILVKSPQPRWLYAYFDATDLCEFILECCKLCVEEDLLSEVIYLRAHDNTVKDLEAWLDMRQSQLNTLIDVIVQGNGTLSKRKRKLAEGLTDEQLARVESVVGEHFAAYIDARV
ncbi:Fic family protein [Hydrogenophaga sp.]|jgi:hypothetical protein|uniref:Fic family protein n=1 Tax=Hydrogenophaga sp. TaxID=1904254 RepID=UPI000DB4499C|nr:MAG: hypothetical protein DCF26_01020 [Burkholderiales bacterium]